LAAFFSRKTLLLSTLACRDAKSAARRLRRQTAGGWNGGGADKLPSELPDLLHDLRIGQGRDVPGVLPAERAASTRRMIFPDLVFGMSGTIQTCFGRAILPMFSSIARMTFSSIPAVSSTPGLSEI
jgi:hypothetical protein